MKCKFPLEYKVDAVTDIQNAIHDDLGKFCCDSCSLAFKADKAKELERELLIANDFDKAALVGDNYACAVMHLQQVVRCLFAYGYDTKNDDREYALAHAEIILGYLG